MDLSLGIPSLDSQEKDTAIERAFGKNSLTDFFGDIYRAANKGLEQSSLVDPSINLYREGAEADDETILNFIKTNEETNKNIMQSDEMREFNNIYEESGGGWWGFVKGAALNPTVLTQELVSSIAMQIGALKSDEVATAATGGLVAGATGAGLATGINLDTWNSFTLSEQSIIRQVLAFENTYTLAEFNHHNAIALDTLINKHKVKMRTFSDEIMSELKVISEGVIEEVSTRTEISKRIFNSFKDSMKRLNDWSSKSEQAYMKARSIK